MNTSPSGAWLVVGKRTLPDGTEMQLTASSLGRTEERAREFYQAVQFKRAPSLLDGPPVIFADHELQFFPVPVDPPVLQGNQKPRLP